MTDANTAPYAITPALAIQLGAEALAAYMLKLGVNAIVWDEDERKLVWASVDRSAS